MSFYAACSLEYEVVGVKLGAIEIASYALNSTRVDQPRLVCFEVWLGMR
jgi:hypothetical protein